MKRNLLSIRPFNVGGGFEIRMLSGKTILMDPCFTYYLADKSIHSRFAGGYTREDVEGADYIFLTHSHWDHDIDIGYFVKRYHSKVLCSVMCAEEILKYHGLCYDDIFPVFPDRQYTMEDFSFRAFPGKHNAMPGRKFEENCQIAAKIGVTDHARCDQLGNLFSLDYLITTNEGVTVLMASGQPVWRDIFDVCRQVKPDLLLRQAGFKVRGEQISAETMGELLLSYHAKVIIPYHQELMINQRGKEWTDEYFLQIKQYIEEKSAAAQFVIPTAWKWYSMGYDVSVQE